MGSEHVLSQVELEMDPYVPVEALLPQLLLLEAVLLQPPPPWLPPYAHIVLVLEVYVVVVERVVWRRWRVSPRLQRNHRHTGLYYVHSLLLTVCS
jgi:hypothetical protein